MPCQRNKQSYRGAERADIERHHIHALAKLRLFAREPRRTRTNYVLPVAFRIDPLNSHSLGTFDTRYERCQRALIIIHWWSTYDLTKSYPATCSAELSSRQMVIAPATNLGGTQWFPSL